MIAGLSSICQLHYSNKTEWKITIKGFDVNPKQLNVNERSESILTHTWFFFLLLGKNEKKKTKVELQQKVVRYTTFKRCFNRNHMS